MGWINCQCFRFYGRKDGDMMLHTAMYILITTLLPAMPGVHRGSRLRPCRGKESTCARWQGGARPKRQGGQVPHHTDSQREADRSHCQRRVQGWCQFTTAHFWFHYLVWCLICIGVAVLLFLSSLPPAYCLPLTSPYLPTSFPPYLSPLTSPYLSPLTSPYIPPYRMSPPYLSLSLLLPSLSPLLSLSLSLSLPPLSIYLPSFSLFPFPLPLSLSFPPLSISLSLSFYLPLSSSYWMSHLPGSYWCMLLQFSKRCVDLTSWEPMASPTSVTWMGSALSRRHPSTTTTARPY